MPQRRSSPLIDSRRLARIWDNASTESLGFLAVCLSPGTSILNSGGDFGFDVGCKAVQGIPRASYLVNTTGNAINANDERYALAA